MSKAKAVKIKEEPTEDVIFGGLEELREPKTEIKEEDIEELFTFVEPEVVEKVETTVVVTPLRDFKSSFAGDWYYFIKGKPQRVPIPMRDFLLQNKTDPKIKDIW